MLSSHWLSNVKHCTSLHCGFSLPEWVDLTTDLTNILAYKEFYAEHKSDVRRRCRLTYQVDPPRVESTLVFQLLESTVLSSRWFQM